MATTTVSAAQSYRHVVIFICMLMSHGGVWELADSFFAAEKNPS